MNSKFENSVKVSEGERLTDTCWNDFLNQCPVIFVNISFLIKNNTDIRCCDSNNFE